MINFDGIPDELKSKPHWIVWKYGKNGKTPIFSANGNLASTTNSDTWDFYSDVVEVVDRYDGIGYVLEYGIVCIDMDDCIADGVLNDYAEQIVRTLNSYTEISKSGKGLHIFAYGELPGRNRKTDKIEMYEYERYIAITGNRLPGTPPTIKYRRPEINALYESLPVPVCTSTPIQTNGKYKVRDTAEGVIEAIERYGNNEVKKLWRGEWQGNYDSQSEADAALVRYIIYFAGQTDNNQIEAVFKQSELYRDKWDKDIGGYTYGMRTIAYVTGGRL